MQRSTRPRPSERQRLLLAYLVLWLAMPFGVLGNWNSETCDFVTAANIGLCFTSDSVHE